MGDAVPRVTVAEPAVGAWEAAEALHGQGRPVREPALGVEDLGGVGVLLGKHYETYSFCLRLLGAKVGKHVYWPGSGVDVTEYVPSPP